MIFGSLWLTATSPMDPVAYLSKIGVNVVPAFTLFHTPPEAEATSTNRWSVSRLSTSTIRPPALPGPMLRQTKSVSSPSSPGAA